MLIYSVFGVAHNTKDGVDSNNDDHPKSTPRPNLVYLNKTSHRL